MSTTPLDDAAFDDDLNAPEGYKSAAAKSRLVIGVSIASVVFFFAQFIVPQLISFYFMPSMVGMGQGGMFQVETPEVAKAAIWQDQIWVPHTRVIVGATGPQFMLKGATLSGEWVKDAEVTIGFSPRFLLPDGDKLWCVSTGNVAIVEGRNSSTSYPAMKLTSPSNPYLYEGRLRIVDRTAQGDWKVLEFAEGEWTVVGTVRLPTNIMPVPKAITAPPIVTALQNAQRLYVLPTTPPVVVFSDGATCWTATEIPLEAEDDAAVSALAALSDAWTPCPAQPSVMPFLLDGHLAGLESSGPGTAKLLNAVWLDGGKKESFGALTLTFTDQYCVVTAADGRVFVLNDSFPPGQVIVTALTAAGFQTGPVGTRKSLFSGRFGPFFTQYFRAVFISSASTSLMLLLYVAALQFFVARCRNPRYGFAHRTVRLASLMRRAVGRGIDTLIFIGPPSALMVVLLFTLDVEALVQDFGADPIEMLKLGGMLVLGGLTYFLTMTVLYGTLEGLYGWTPGKLAAGVRVVRTTLEPIGILRGMIRQLLLFIDGFFNYLVGGVMVAVMPKQQRLADLATDSIVVDAASLGESELLEERETASVR
jgi:uncharacterized RDD family membrane protein YckC